jgi:hypothetical protein
MKRYAAGALFGALMLAAAWMYLPAAAEAG